MRLFQVSKDKLRAELVEEREKFYAEGVGVIVDLDKKIITILWSTTALGQFEVETARAWGGSVPVHM